MGKVTDFEMHPFDGQMMLLWSEDRPNAATAIRRMIVNHELQVTKPAYDLMLVPTGISSTSFEGLHPLQHLFSADTVSGEAGQDDWGLFHTLGKEYRLKLYDGDTVTATATAKTTENGEGAMSYLQYSAYDQRWHVPYYAVCQGFHLCTYLEAYDSQGMPKRYTSLMEGDVSHELYPSVAAGPAGLLVGLVKHPKNGYGPGGGVETRLFGWGNARTDKTHEYILDGKPYKHDEFSVTAWNGSYAMMFRESVEKTSGYPWGEPGDWITSLAIFDRDWRGYTLKWIRTLQTQGFSPIGRSMRLQAYRNGFLATYPIDDAGVWRPVWQAVSVEGVVGRQMRFDVTVNDAFAAVGIAEGVYTANFGSDGLRMHRFLCEH